MSYEKPNLKSKHFDNLFNNLPSMEGKTVAITGTTSGTGLWPPRLAENWGRGFYC